MKAVSVVVPCYNYARYLPAAIESVLHQTGVEVEVIVVDDRSTDDSLAIARCYAAEDDRVKVIAHTINQGPVASFNDGLAACTGEFLVRLDADDCLTPGSLERATTLAHHFPSVGLIYGHPLHFEGEDLPQPRIDPTNWTIWPGLEWLAARCRSGLNVITSPEVLMRMSIVRKVGGQQPLAHTHDMEMWLRMSAFCDVAYIHGVDQAWHREHSNSLSARHVDASRDLSERYQAFEALFAGIAGDLPEVRELRGETMMALAASGLRAASYCYDHGGAERAEGDRLVTLASSIVSDIEAVHGWAGIRRRRALGDAWAGRHPLVVLDRLRRRISHEFSLRRWHRTGVA